MSPFIVAGHETVASALTWSWYLLGSPPGVRPTGQEAASVFGPDGLPTFDDLPRLRWASAVFDESLRLYPPGWIISRKARAADEIDGHPIPAGALVLISPYLVHRHGCGYEAGDEVFDPSASSTGRPRPARPTCRSAPGRAFASAGRWLGPRVRSC